MTGPQGIPGIQGLGGVLTNYGQFYNTTITNNQTALLQAASGTLNTSELDTTLISNGITVQNGTDANFKNNGFKKSRITVSTTGIYYFDHRLQISPSWDSNLNPFIINVQTRFFVNGSPISRTFSDQTTTATANSQCHVVRTTCILSLNVNDYVEVKFITPNNYTVNYWIGQQVNGVPGLISDYTSCMQLNVFQLAYNGPTGPQGNPGLIGYTGAKGDTGPPVSVGAYTSYTTATLNRAILQTFITSNLTTGPDATCISIPNATVIYINTADSNSRYINNMYGGVNGRKVIFTLLITNSNNGDVTFTQQFAKNGTGIFIGGTNGSVAITSGGSICFVYVADARLPDGQGYNNPGAGSGLWMYQYKS